LDLSLKEQLDLSLTEADLSGTSLLHFCEPLDLSLKEPSDLSLKEADLNGTSLC
jgi:hypothetical protein